MRKGFLFMVVLLALALDNSAQNPRNVVLYNLTSTGCGPCSCMDSIIRNVVMPNYPNTVVIALHSPTEMGGSAFWNYQGSKIYSQFNSTSDPDGFVDGQGHDSFYRYIGDSIGKRLQDSPQAPVRIVIENKTWNPGTLMMDFTARITNIGNDLPGSYWYNIFVTEDNLKQTHRIEYGCATPDDPNHQPLRSNYFNDHVIRRVEFFEVGDSLVGPKWPMGREFVKNFSIRIDSPWVAGNTHINLVVYQHADSIYKSLVQQAICQSVTGAVGMPGSVIPVRSEIMLLYPNPATDLINIHYSVSVPGACTLEIYNGSGKKLVTLVDQLQKSGQFNVEYRTHDLPEGCYLITLRTPSGESSRQMVTSR